MEQLHDNALTALSLVWCLFVLLAMGIHVYNTDEARYSTASNLFAALLFMVITIMAVTHLIKTF